MPRGQRGKLKLPEHGAWGSPERVTETEKTHSGSFFFPLCSRSTVGRFFGAKRGTLYLKTEGAFFFVAKEELARGLSWPCPRRRPRDLASNRVHLTSSKQRRCLIGDVRV